MTSVKRLSRSRWQTERNWSRVDGTARNLNSAGTMGSVSMRQAFQRPS